MNKAIFIFILTITVNSYPQIKGLVTLNEIMFTPQIDQNEFVELYNSNNKDSVDLNNFKIKYYSSQPNIITSAGFGTMLPPKSYAIVLEGDYDIFSGIYTSVIPQEALILKIKEGSFGTSGMANTIGRPLWLLDNLNDTLDVYTYSANNNKGYSDEKVLSSKDSSKSNWKNSIMPNGTPGFLNSVSPKESDLAITDIVIIPDSTNIGKYFKIEVVVQNEGTKEENFSLQLFEDTNLDSLPDVMLQDYTQLFLAPKQSTSFITDYVVHNFQNKKGFYAKIYCKDDQVEYNDYFYKSVLPDTYDSVIFINEVMYSPANGESEWVEIYNTSNDSISLKDWSITDILTTPAKATINNKFYIPPNSYLVILKDSSFMNYSNLISQKVLILNLPVLNNDNDGIVLKNNLGITIDSLFYKNTWGGTSGYSLERISLSAPTNDSTNWMTCINKNKSTPGQPNSSNEIIPYNMGEMVINEIMFDPAVDNSEFIEFLNTSLKAINIGGWKIEFEDKSYHNITNTGLSVPSGAYFVLSSDSSYISKYSLSNSRLRNVLNKASIGLTNSGKLILLKDALGNTIDSVRYSASWHNKNLVSTKNISLERINPRLNGNDRLNWSSSTDKNGATPSKQNSIFSIIIDKAANISVSTNPFSPDNDGFEDFTIINYHLTQRISQIRIKIFDSQGRLVRTLINNQASGSNGSVVFNGLDDAGFPLRIGIYIIFLEALNENFGTIENIKIPVVIARKLR